MAGNTFVHKYNQNEDGMMTFVHNGRHLHSYTMADKNSYQIATNNFAHKIGNTFMHIHNDNQTHNGQ